MGGIATVSLFFTTLFQLSAAEVPERVTVRVYDAFNLPPGELCRAEREAEAMFRMAGIHLTWEMDPLHSGRSRNTPAEIWDPITLQVRIWTRAMVPKRISESDDIGFCISIRAGDVAVLADAWPKGTNEIIDHGDIMGLAIAHEFGHVLLRSTGHSVTGIMKRRWTVQDLRDGARGYLRFTAEQAESMRNEVRRRAGRK